MTSKIHRRDFVKGTAAAGAGFFIAEQYAGAAPTRKTKDQKLNVAIIGCGGRGYSNLRQMKDENVIAMVDVDAARGGAGYKFYPDAKRYTDYRDMYAKHAMELDAVVVSTPDHMHALVALEGMRHGVHVYCEKPLSWSIEEAREMTMIAKKNGLATQMGNDRCANTGFRNNVTALREGVIGEVREVHVWTNRPVWPQAMDTPTEEHAVPENLDWKKWLGPTRHRPYNKIYLPFNWRGWYDWGTGALGDMACHCMHLPFLGLQLGHCESVVAESSKLFAESYPATCKVTYKYPARGALPPVTMYWYDGNPKTPGRFGPPKEVLDRCTDENGKPAKLDMNHGVLLVGSKGIMYSQGDYGIKSDLFPKVKFKDKKRYDPFKGTTRGHHYEWRMACRGEGEPLSNFITNAGPFTETVLLGNLALRTGKEINWDYKTMSAKGVPEADPLVRRKYLNGYSIR